MTTEVPAQPSPEPAAAPTTPEPSGLDAVYSQYGIEDDAATFQPQSQQPVAQPAPQPSALPKVPDPFSPEFAAYQAQMANGVSSLHQAFQQLAGKISAQEQAFQQRQVEADIKQAVGTLTEGTGLKPKIAEVALEAKAREDKRFLKIWNNRQQNPQAYQAALKAFKSELEQEYTVRQDPQLVENQRAVAASRQAMATTQKVSENDKWANMSAQEREQERNRIRRMG